MSFEPFWVDYDRTRGIGMHSVLGSDPDLVQMVENIVIGMDTDGEWALGGPMVWIHDTARIVAWVRPIPAREAGRAGAARAWGVRTHVDDDVVHWPLFWDLFASEPSRDNLQELASGLANPRRGKVPPKISDEFAGVLTEAYRTRVRGDAAQTFYIPLQRAGELPALAWFWLLGPADPSHATLGPPRRTAAATRPPLTYAGQIGDGRRTFPASEIIGAKLLLPIRSGKVEAAIQAARELRALPPAQLSETIDPPPTMRKPQPLTIERAPITAPAEEEPRISLGRKIDFISVRDWTIFALAVAQILLLIVILGLLGTPQVLIENTRPGTNTMTTGTVAHTATTAPPAPAPADELTLNVAGEALLSALKKPRAGIAYAKPIAEWIKKPAFGRSDVARARTAALQIYAMRHGCAAAGSPVDGTIGPGFYDALHCLARHRDPLDVFTNDQKLIDWLQATQ